MISLKKIEEFLKNNDMEYTYYGKIKIEINNYSTLDNIKSNSILWIKNHNDIEKYNLDEYDNLLVVTENVDRNTNGNFLVSNNPKGVFFSIISNFFDKKNIKSHIERTSTVETLKIADGVYIGHNCYINSDVIIGENVTIRNNVVIEGSVKIGNNTVISSGVIIGSDGYGYYRDAKNRNVKVPHLGGVVIGNNVDIGANTCIDRGTLGDTVIEDNVKIDNLCHIAHNVHIEENVNVIALSMIAGSVILKKNSYVAPSASIKNQLTIGENSLVGLGSVVVKNVENDVVVAGVPARIIKKLGE